MSTPVQSFLFIVCFSLLTAASTNPHRWFEGCQRRDDGATRDYYNREARLPWQNLMGDWKDRDNVAQGDNGYASISLDNNDTSGWVQWDVTALVREWVEDAYPNKGMILRAVSRDGTAAFVSREGGEQYAPRLVVTAGEATVTLHIDSDTHLRSDTYQCYGDAQELELSSDRNILLYVNVDKLKKIGTIQSARLEMYGRGDGITDAGIFRLDQGGDQDVLSRPAQGLASQYPGDEGIESDPDVIFAHDFDEDWRSDWSSIGYEQYGAEANESEGNGFEPFMGKAARSRIPAGENNGMSLYYDFAEEIGYEPEEVYFRYYLRFGENWQATVDGGKLPGLGGTYNRAGWGGAPSHGDDGWSARATFRPRLSDDNPLAPASNPIGSYCYHGGMDTQYGDIWVWTEGANGYLENNRWYSVEQYVKMNTPGQNDGIIRAWVDGRLAFEKTDIRFRDVDHLKIERIWMNIYHG
ncbi:MAG: polysaccharide lyase, partial [Chitinispirillaceae bacterium]